MSTRISIVRKAQFYLMLVVYLALATARPEQVMPAGFNDLVVHFIAYAVLFNSCLLAYGAGSNRINIYLFLLAYSFLIEVVQYTLPYRSFSLLDMLANALGLYAGQWIGTGLIQAMRWLDFPWFAPGREQTPEETSGKKNGG